MKTNAITLRTLCLALGGLATCAASAATLDVRAASTTAGNPFGTVDSLSLSNYDGTVYAVNSSSNAGGQSDGWIAAAAGSFHSLAHAHVGAPGETASQSNHAGVIDQLFVNSASLALGTPVDLSFSMMYDGFTSYLQSPDPINGPNMYIVAILEMSLAANSTKTSHQLYLPLISNNGLPNGASAQSISGVLHSVVGDTINFQQLLTLGAGAQFFDGETRDVTADFSNTFQFFADSLNPAVTLSSQTGHDYSISAVPEPGSAPMLVAGCGLLGWLVRRRRAPKIAP